MPRTIELPEALSRRLSSEAARRGVDLEFLVLELLADVLCEDERSKAEAYRSAAEHFLAKASEELSRGDLRQASEKIWGAAALAVKALAYEREGRRLTSHGEFWEYVNRLVAETGDEEIGRTWRTAVSMHANFYEGWAPAEEVKRALDEVRGLVERLKGL